MWSRPKYLSKPRKDKSGKRWNFQLWYEVWTETKVHHAQRIFFWDDTKQICGVVLFTPGTALHSSRLKQLIDKLIADPTLREKYRRKLRFPLEKHYSDYGAFPEEIPAETLPTS